jgi:hypothetical protein
MRTDAYMKARNAFVRHFKNPLDTKSDIAWPYIEISLSKLSQSLNKESREIDEHLEGYISFMADYGS